MTDCRTPTWQHQAAAGKSGLKPARRMRARESAGGHVHRSYTQNSRGGEHKPFGGAVLMGTGVRGANRKPEECCATKAKKQQGFQKEMDRSNRARTRADLIYQPQATCVTTLQLTKIKLN